MAGKASGTAVDLFDGRFLGQPNHSFCQPIYPLIGHSFPRTTNLNLVVGRGFRNQPSRPPARAPQVGLEPRTIPCPEALRPRRVQPPCRPTRATAPSVARGPGREIIRPSLTPEPARWRATVGLWGISARGASLPVWCRPRHRRRPAGRPLESVAGCLEPGLGRSLHPAGLPRGRPAP